VVEESNVNNGGGGEGCNEGEMDKVQMVGGSVGDVYAPGAQGAGPDSIHPRLLGCVGFVCSQCALPQDQSSLDDPDVSGSRPVAFYNLASNENGI
jgi:hypothetical protein